MAIFGDLQDMPLVDLLSMLGGRSGLLDVWDVGGKRNRYILALDRGNLLWVKDEGGYLDPLKARSTLLELASAGRGAFELTPVEPPKGSPLLNWPIERVIQPPKLRHFHPASRVMSCMLCPSASSITSFGVRQPRPECNRLSW